MRESERESERVRGERRESGRGLEGRETYSYILPIVNCVLTRLVRLVTSGEASRDGFGGLIRTTLTVKARTSRGWSSRAHT